MEHTEVQAAEPPGFFSSAREQKPPGFALGEPELELCMGGWGGGGNDSLGESPGQDTPERKNIPKYHRED